MFDDDIFEEEVDEEAAAELEKKRKQEQEKATESGYTGSSNAGDSFGGYSGPQYSGYSGPVYGRKHEQIKARDTKGFGIASMVLGIISLLLFCSCINVPTAVISIIFAIIVLKESKEKTYRRMAIAGLITSILSVVMLIGSWTLVFSNENLDDMFGDGSGIEYYFNYDGGSGEFDLGPFQEYDDDNSDDLFNNDENVETL